MKRQLLFEVGPHLFAADAAGIQGVLEPCPATPIPGAPTPVLGLINVRGTLMTVVELAALLDLPANGGEEASFVILERGARRLALKVDRLVGVTPHPAGGPDVGGELLEALGAGDVVVGVGEFGGRPYYQLDVRVIFERVLGDKDGRPQSGQDRQEE